jgi:Skp family chaperone for outer membrane proteins
MLIASMAIVANAAPPAVTTGGVGVVDVQQVQKDYKGAKKAAEIWKAFIDEKRASITILQDAIGLDKLQTEEYLQLTRPSQMVVSEKIEKRINELKEIAKKNMGDLEKLEAKKTSETKLTEDEQKQLDALAPLKEAGNAAYEASMQKTDGEVAAKRELLVSAIEDAQNAAIEKVYKAKKLSAILAKEIQVGENAVKTLLYGGTDITADVVAAMNAAYKDNIFDEKKPVVKNN